MLLVATAPCSPVYAASTQYARANHEEAYFYSEDRKRSLFAVPETYYVEVLDEEGEWYKVQYADNAGNYKALNGYCKKQDFTLETAEPRKIYLNKTVMVTYTAPENTSSLPALDNLKYEAAYYGNYKHGGDDYSYVYCQGSFGYILGKIEDYEPNAPVFANGGGTESGSGAGLNFATIAFIVIASLSVVVILIIYFTTKKPRIDG